MLKRITRHVKRINANGGMNAINKTVNFKKGKENGIKNVHKTRNAGNDNGNDIKNAGRMTLNIEKRNESVIGDGTEAIDIMTLTTEKRNTNVTRSGT